MNLNSKGFSPRAPRAALDDKRLSAYAAPR